MTGGASPRIASLGVLPLENLSGDPEQAYFVDGMQEALTAELSRIRALRVVPRTSTLRHQHLAKSLPEIARALNVDGLIEGSVLMAGNRVRVTVKLIHGASDRQLWGDSYEQSLEDVLALQTEVARAIAAQIQVAVTAEEARYLSRSSCVNPAAYQAVPSRKLPPREGEARGTSRRLRSISSRPLSRTRRTPHRTPASPPCSSNLGLWTASYLPARFMRRQ